MQQQACQKGFGKAGSLAAGAYQDSTVQDQYYYADAQILESTFIAVGLLHSLPYYAIGGLFSDNEGRTTFCPTSFVASLTFGACLGPSLKKICCSPYTRAAPTASLDSVSIHGGLHRRSSRYNIVCASMVSVEKGKANNVDVPACFVIHCTETRRCKCAPLCSRWIMHDDLIALS